MTVFLTRQAAAERYIADGFSPIPLPARSKDPSVNGKHWQRKSYDAVQFAGEGNIGLFTGTRSSNLVDVDLDAPEAIRAARHFLPLTGMRHGRASKPNSHYWYRAVKNLPSGRKAYEDPMGGMLVELRSSSGATGIQTVVPPSVHESGEAVAWASYGTPAEVDGTDLGKSVRLVAAVALLARYWPREGKRHAFTLALAGYLLNGKLDEALVSDIISTAAQIAGDEEAQERVKNVETTARKLATGEQCQGGSTLKEYLDSKVLTCLSEWLGLARVKATKSQQAEARTRALLSSSSIINLENVIASKVEWLWEGRIPLGTLTLIDGDPGLGKTMLAACLAACVTRGRLLPDGTPGVDGGAVLVSVEDDLARTIKPRLQAAGADLSRVRAIQLVKVVNEDTGEVWERPFSIVSDLPLVEDAIAEVGAKLVVIDPIMACLDSSIDSHKDQQVRTALVPLIKLAERTGCAVVIIRHLSKNETGNALYRGGGSIAFIGAARSALLLAKHPEDEEKRVLAPLKANLGKTPKALAYHITAGADEVPYIVWDGMSDHTASSLMRKPMPLSEGHRAILDVLREYGRPVSPQQIAGETGQGESTVRSSLSRLKTRGDVECDTRGFYSLPTHTTTQSRDVVSSVAANAAVAASAASAANAANAANAAQSESGYPNAALAASAAPLRTLQHVAATEDGGVGPLAGRTKKPRRTRTPVTPDRPFSATALLERFTAENPQREGEKWAEWHQRWVEFSTPYFDAAA